ncbi:MAG TPA: hypothetical protein PKD54_11060 [Pirellulaceae bacterium]|nr:hypothetical protein [Pirellulaceae bacterium]
MNPWWYRFAHSRLALVAAGVLLGLLARAVIGPPDNENDGIRRYSVPLSSEVAPLE